MNRYGSKDALKRTLYLAASSIGSATPLRSRFRRQLRVLMYHKVNDVRPNTISVRVDAFAAQQHFLQQKCRVVSPQELDEALDHPGGSSPHILLTFDDGYRDNLLNAYPILKELGHRAFLFVPTDFVGGKYLPHDAKLPTSNPTLTWDEIRSMQDVFEIGAHGCSHTPLTRLSLPAARDEIATSKVILEDRLQIEVRAFSYPRGTPDDFSPEAEDMIREAGYRFCFTTVPGGNGEGANRLRLKRVNVEDFGSFYFRALLNGTADTVGVKDTPGGLKVKGALNRALGTRG